MANSSNVGSRICWLDKQELLQQEGELESYGPALQEMLAATEIFFKEPDKFFGLVGRGFMESFGR